MLLPSVRCEDSWLQLELISSCFNSLVHSPIVSKTFVKHSYLWPSPALVGLTLRSFWPTRFAWVFVQSWRLQLCRLWCRRTTERAPRISCISSASTLHESKSRCGSDTKDWKKGTCLPVLSNSTFWASLKYRKLPCLHCGQHRSIFLCQLEQDLYW